MTDREYGFSLKALLANSTAKKKVQCQWTYEIVFRCNRISQAHRRKQFTRHFPFRDVWNVVSLSQCVIKMRGRTSFIFLKRSMAYVITFSTLSED